MKAQWLLVALALPQYDLAQERHRTTGLAARCAVIAALRHTWGEYRYCSPETLGSPLRSGAAGPEATLAPPTVSTDDSIQSWNVTGVTSEARRHGHSGAPSEQSVSARGGRRRDQQWLDN